MTSTRPQKGKLDPHVAATFAYMGGAITGIMFLAVEKNDRFVRFHAMQSTVTFVLVLVANFVLSGLPLVGRILRVAFLVAVALLWVWLMYQAFSGKKYKLPYVGDFAEQSS